MAEYKGDPQMEEEMAKLSWPEAPKIITGIPGPKSKALLEKEMANETITRAMPNLMPGAWKEAFGATVKDLDGNVSIDLISGVAVNNVGHCHPEVVQAIHDQAEKLTHVSNLYYNELQPRLAKALSERAFGGKCFFCNSGAEANEALIKLARLWLIATPYQQCQDMRRGLALAA